MLCKKAIAKRYVTRFLETPNEILPDASARCGSRSAGAFGSDLAAAIAMAIIGNENRRRGTHLKYDATENSVRASSAFRVISISLWGEIPQYFCNYTRRSSPLVTQVVPFILCLRILSQYDRNFSGTACDRILGPATLIIFNPISRVFAYADYDVFERSLESALISAVGRDAY